MPSTCEQLRQAEKEYSATPAGFTLALRLEVSTLLIAGLNRKNWTTNDLARITHTPEDSVIAALYADADWSSRALGKWFHALGIRSRIVEVTGEK